MICVYCGYNAIKGDRFCLKCGVKIEHKQPKKRHDPPRKIRPKISHKHGEDNPHISRELSPKQWGRFIAAWVIFVVIACGAVFVAFWHFDEIVSFFQPADYYPSLAENLENVNLEDMPYEVVLPIEVQDTAEEPHEDMEPEPELEPEPEPQALLPIMSQSTIAAGSGHYLAISQTSHLWSWGTNTSGQLGIGTTEEHLRPVLVMNDAVSVHAALDRSVVITGGGLLWGFGNNERGQLGDGTTTNRNLPVLVLEDVVFVSITDEATFAITDDNGFWAWGANDEGQLGDGTTIDRHSPTLIRDDGLEFAREIGLIEYNPVWQENYLSIDGERVAYISANPQASLMLTEGGYVWVYWGNALEAIERWNEDEFEIVMANVRLPTEQVPY